MPNEVFMPRGADFNNASLIRPTLQNYAEIVNALGNATGSITINLLLGNLVTATSTGITTWTFSNPVASGKGCSFTLFLTNGGAYAQTWPAGITLWASGTAPTLTASGMDILAFLTIDGGSTWIGIIVALDVKL